MSRVTDEITKPRRRWVSAQTLSVVEVVVLAPLAAILAFWLVPLAFDIEWSCVGGSGIVTGSGESFAETLAVVGTIGWFAVLLGTLYASISERERLAAILPVAWFLVLVIGMTVAAAAVGPAPCPV